MTEQIVLNTEQSFQELEDYIKKSEAKKLLLVCGKSFLQCKYYDFFQSLEEKAGVKVVRFSDFSPNPAYESVVSGVKVFQENGCDMIVAAGGGSAMDVAKCIKLYGNLPMGTNYLEQQIIPNEIKLLAIPTTAGTGSEATRFAVIYYQGEKQSVADVSCIPEAVILDAELLNSLPLYQKKATMLDALCHAIESFWSVNSTEESRAYSKEAIRMILEFMNGYLNNEPEGNRKMLQASNIAGKAINITQTTAGHAMCYKLTSLYGISHGHAAALCVSGLWRYMLSHPEKCIDGRGAEYLMQMFRELSLVMGTDSCEASAEKFQEILIKLEMTVPVPKQEDFEILKTSVNPVRLKNNPVELDIVAIEKLYREILQKR